MIGNEKNIMGLIKLVSTNPELNQIIISLSLNQRLRVSKIVRKRVKVNKIGKYLSKLKIRMVTTESLGIIPLEANRKTTTPLCAITMPDKINIVDKEL